MKKDIADMVECKIGCYTLPRSKRYRDGRKP